MCFFPVSWKKLEPYSIYGNNADLIFFLMVSQNLSTKYLEMMPQSITASEYQQPLLYCW